MSSRTPDINHVAWLRPLLLFALVFIAVNGSAMESQAPATESEARDTESCPDDALLEAHQVQIRTVILDKNDVFDTEDPDENKSLFRLANRLHIDSRDSTIESQLLFDEGDLYSRRLLDETERLLRAHRYLYDAHIYPSNCRDGLVDIIVSTRDVWTLNLGFSGSRSGGANSTNVEFEELNLLGLGSKLSIDLLNDVDRNSTIFEYSDAHFGKSWTRLSLRLIDSSDGSTTALQVERPFYSLDSRYALGGEYLQDDRVDHYYDSGESISSYRHERDFVRIYGGRSRGLNNGWVSRWTGGFVFDEDRFSSASADLATVPLPQNRKFVYPFAGFELIEDNYDATKNQNQIDRTEDVFLGTRLAAEIGWSNKRFGADNDAIVYAAQGGTGFGSPESSMLLFNSGLSGWVQSGNFVNTRLGLDAELFRRQSDYRLFYAGASIQLGNDLVLDDLVDIGGDIGLRGYPQHYQTGESRAVFTLEQRIFTDWYLFRIFRVGGAAFVDAGHIWGENPIAENAHGWLTDVGFGLRLGSTRSGSGRMIHLDFAFPLNGDSSIDDFQIQFETKKGF